MHSDRSDRPTGPYDRPMPAAVSVLVVRAILRFFWRLGQSRSRRQCVASSTPSCDQQQGLDFATDLTAVLVAPRMLMRLEIDQKALLRGRSRRQRRCAPYRLATLVFFPVCSSSARKCFTVTNLASGNPTCPTSALLWHYFIGCEAVGVFANGDLCPRLNASSVSRRTVKRSEESRSVMRAPSTGAE